MAGWNPFRPTSERIDLDSIGPEDEWKGKAISERLIFGRSLDTVIDNIVAGNEALDNDTAKAMTEAVSDLKPSSEIRKTVERMIASWRKRGY